MGRNDASWKFVACLVGVSCLLAGGSFLASGSSLSSPSGAPTPFSHSPRSTYLPYSSGSPDPARGAVLAKSTNGISILANVTLASVSITPNSVLLSPTGAQNFTTNVTCSGGPCPAGITYRWNMSKSGVGVLNNTTASSVEFQAGTGNGSLQLNVTAELGNQSVKSPNASIQVSYLLGELSSVKISPVNALVSAGGLATFTATLGCKGSCPTFPKYVWNLSKPVGTLGGAGYQTFFTAGATGGVANVTVVVSAEGIVRTSTAVVRVLPLTEILNSVSVDPYELTLEVNQFASFSMAENCTGGPCPLSLLNQSWTLSSPLGTLTQTQGTSTTFTAGGSAGVEDLTAIATMNGTTVRTTVPITIVTTPLPKLLSLHVTPLSTTLEQGGTQDFTASPACSSACPSGIPVTWSMGGPSTNLGTFNTTQGNAVAFTASNLTSSGQYRVYVSAQLGNNSVATWVNVTLTGTLYFVVSSVQITPSNPSIIPGGKVNLTANPGCSPSYCGGTMTYNWTLSSSLGTLNVENTSTVTFLAGPTAGSVQVQVYVWDEGYGALSRPVVVNITPNLVTVTSVAVSPSSVTLSPGGQQTFTAKSVCSSSCPPGIHYAWKLLGTDGHFNPQLDPAAVSFLAGNTVGQDTLQVTATLNGSSPVGKASITISNGSSNIGPPIGNASSSSKLSPEEIAGIVGVAVVGVAVVLVLALRARRKSRPPAPTPASLSPTPTDPAPPPPSPTEIPPSA